MMDDLFADFKVPAKIIGKRCALLSIGRTAENFYEKSGFKRIQMSRATEVKRTANKAAINNYLTLAKIPMKVVHPVGIFLTYDTGFQTLLIFSKKMTAENVITDLEDSGGKALPITIWIALIASMDWIESPIPVRDSIGALQDLVYQNSVEKVSELEWIRDGASEDPNYPTRWIENILIHGEFPPEKYLSPGSAAGIIWIVARLLWDKDEIRNTAQTITKKSEWLVSCLGTFMMNITGCEIRFKGGSTKPRIFIDKDYKYNFLDLWFWRMCIQFRALYPHISIVNHLFPKGIPNLIAEDTTGKLKADVSLESVMAIVNEAYERRVYPTPEEGVGYSVDIPFEPVKEIFTECRIWPMKARESQYDLVYVLLDGPFGGIWYALQMNEEHLSFIWETNHPSFKVIATMIVGIWRDLIGEGEEVFPAYEEEEVEAGEPESTTPRPYKASNKNPDRTLYLPRSRYVRWGPAKERKWILRRVRKGSEIPAKAINLTRSGRRPSLKQIRLAEEYGITLPPGWTFRKEHWRGPRQAEGDEERPKISKCRGLSTVAYLLGDLLNDRND
jgi:hypothetical protein